MGNEPMIEPGEKAIGEADLAGDILEVATAAIDEDVHGVVDGAGIVGLGLDELENSGDCVVMGGAG